MIAQYIQVGRRNWNILIYYWVDQDDFFEIEESLSQLGCSKKDIKKAFQVLKKRNTGFTYSDTDYKMSIVCISKTTTISEFVNTAIHEAKHVQSHICQYYGIEENSENAAYLIGYIVQRMYKMFSKFVKTHV